MIEVGSFEALVERVLGLRLSGDVNRSQRSASLADVDSWDFVVAGPGSGKTTAVTLRVLKHIFCDDLEPPELLAVTFTRKAAKVLRSRTLEWGELIRVAARREVAEHEVLSRLERLDLNAIHTGTLDSIAQEFLRDDRAPGGKAPVVLEEFVSSALMTRFGLFQDRRFRSDDLRNYISALRGSGGSYGLNTGTLAGHVMTIRERLAHDMVDREALRTSLDGGGLEVALDAVTDYEGELTDRYATDYAGLEEDFYRILNADQLGRSREVLEDLRVVFVDEYQDTNLLQEAIYFCLAQSVLSRDGSVSVVGDDDQSLYRFRGATVDLFQSYSERLQRHLGVDPRRIFLNNNYRSTTPIVAFVNDFVRLDDRYQRERVESKPDIVKRRPATAELDQIPVLGLFRDDRDILAADLAAFIGDVFVGGGFQLPNGHTVVASDEGSAGDCALLAHSVRELKGNRQRLPGLLRQRLERDYGIQVFNPRGRSLPNVRSIALLCGLLLECIDPESRIQAGIAGLPSDAVAVFDGWRRDAKRFAEADEPNAGSVGGLPEFIDAWQRREPQAGGDWPHEVHIADLIYKLTSWIPEMQDDIEGLVHLEVVLRTVAQASAFGAHRGFVVEGDRQEPSVRELYWDVFVSLATEKIEVDEDLLETLPRNRLNMLTIHQAKGLEFPVVIVDVGSDFTMNHWKQARARYPREGDVSHRLEDQLREYSELGPPSRADIDRAFDDLIRLYFVAFSRAVDVLVLTGLSSVRGVKDDGSAVKSAVKNVATGWSRDEDWKWGSGLPVLQHI